MTTKYYRLILQSRKRRVSLAFSAIACLVLAIAKAPDWSETAAWTLLAVIVGVEAWIGATLGRTTREKGGDDE